MVTQFGKYTLLKKLALGGMAEIFLAKQTGVQGFEKLVVVKRILPQLAQEREFLQMFLDEARLAASLNHPNVVQIYDLGNIEDAYFIAMEFIAGQDLLSVVTKTRSAAADSRRMVPPNIAAKILIGACEGLHYAHTRKDNRGNPLNIIHRDVSPSNILVSYEGGVKVVDFGIAKAESHSSKTQAGKLKGKYSYMSPEQISDEPLDPRSDVFALGIVLMELLIARGLFRGNTELAIIQSILEGEVKPPSALRPDIPKALDQICLKALEKDRKKRYGSAQELQFDLEKFLAQLPEPTSSVHVAQFVDELFAEEHAAYQKLLSELPTAAPEELARLLEAQASQPRPSISSPAVPVTALRETNPEVSAVTVPKKRGALKAVLGVAGALAFALAAVGAYVATRPEPVIAVAGDISLESDPKGATVILDGMTSAVTTPGVLRAVSFGKDHLIRLELDGHEAREATVRLSPEVPNKTISLSLPPSAIPPGTVELVTEPPGATVFLDGATKKGVTPMSLSSVSAGVDHLLRVSLDGFLDEASIVKVESGGTATVKLKLKPNTGPVAVVPVGGKKDKKKPAIVELGTVRLTSVPPTEVFHLGKSLGRTPVVARLPAGRVELAFINKELELTQISSVEVTANGQSDARMEFKKGKLAADVTPWADVYLGERKLGTTPLAPRELYEGSYQIRLVNSELGAIKTLKVTVSPGRTTVVREALQ